MASLLIRDLDKATVDRLKARAKSNGRSLEAEVIAIFEEETRLYAVPVVREPASPYRVDPQEPVGRAKTVRRDRGR